ncbi:hypothetical protein, partial [Thiomonas sp.]|uniref:hypothetical protein n=1 Tax=Thiomonas sp. TaxID=2047785 RepID=UPI0025898415
VPDEQEKTIFCVAAASTPPPVGENAGVQEPCAEYVVQLHVPAISAPDENPLTTLFTFASS